ncbi:DndE family protein [Flavobacterium sp. Sd200]|uniref:DndE family protein n=1 Tax=Flavobacterium sp. Sd200 TaxID=2692211 RepID=UPI00136B4990|nr:DndE family protein [Flavobacterium sp. Sd200]MXN91704.1 DndE family protein [Flavobacterium sp. Sd200]
MFTQIKTSKVNKDVVTQLTRKLGLGTENVVARIAFNYSLSKERKLDLTEIADSHGKEYSKAVLFGDHDDIYIGLICVHYGIYKTDKDISRYIKMHIDDGLTLLNDEVNNLNNMDGFDFLVEKIEAGLAML